MRPSRGTQQAQQIFADAGSLDGESLKAFLDDACGSDERLRREVETLLDHRDKLRTADLQAAVGLPSCSVLAPSATESVGHYRLGTLLGEGGMGSVFLAEQTFPLRRTVAVKLLRPEFDSREVIARFQAERQVLAMLDHPNIARVVDAGSTPDGRPYFVLEHVPGKPITQFADDQRLSIEARLRLFIQVCDAIAHAHTKAIIHRDIKPSNVLAYEQDGQPTVKVIDFGIAKALDGARMSDLTVHTRVGAVVGSFESMSPEQADGTADVDTRSDVYSLGVLLYELISGVKPFDRRKRGSDFQLHQEIRGRDASRPSSKLLAPGVDAAQLADRRQTRVPQLVRELRGELEWIPLKAMRRDPARRYQTAAELAADVRNYLSGKPLSAGPESRRYRLRKYVSRNRVAVTLASAAIVSLVGGLIAASVQSARAVAQAERAASAERTATAQRVHAEQNAAIAMIQQADAFLQVERFQEAEQLYRRAKSELTRLNDRPWIADLGLFDLAVAVNPPIAVLPLTRREITSLRFMPDGKRVAATSLDGVTATMDVRSGKIEDWQESDMGHSEIINIVDISDAGVIALGRRQSKRELVHIVGSPDRAKPAEVRGGTLLSMSPSGRSLARTSPEFNIEIWHDGVLVHSEPAVDASRRDVVFIDDDRWVSLSAERVSLWTRGRRSPDAVVRGVPGARLFASPDRRSIAVTLFQKGVLVMDVDPLRIRVALSGSNGKTEDVAWSPDGTLLAACAWDGPVRVWDVKTGELSILLAGSSAPLNSIAFSPDGYRIAAGGWDGLVYVWDRRPVPAKTQMPEMPPTRWGADFQSICDGRLIVWCETESAPVVFDRYTGRIVHRFPAEQHSNGLELGANQTEVVFTWFNGTGSIFDFQTLKEVGRLNTPVSVPNSQVFLWRAANAPRLIMWRRYLKDFSTWDLDTRTGHPLQFEPTMNWQTHISPDGRWALVFGGVSERGILRYDLDHPDQPPVARWRTGSKEGGATAVFSPDGELVLTRQTDANNFGVVLRTRDLSEVCTIPDGHDVIVRDQFWPDSAHLLSTTSSGMLVLRDFPSGQVLHTFKLKLHAGAAPFRVAGSLFSGRDNPLILYDFDWPNARQALADDVDAARRKLLANPGDAGALAVMGRWYLVHGIDDWAIESFEAAIESGGSVDALTLARCYDRLGRIPQAVKEYQRALSGSTDPLEQCALRMILQALTNPVGGPVSGAGPVPARHP
jgi:serine/threonine protein kinase/WD40 repeat protein